MYITDEDVQGVLDFVNTTDTGRMMVSVMDELDSLRKTYILKCGVYDAPGARVFDSTPESILPLSPTTSSRDRLGLAKWTISKDNTLNDSVYARRLWHLIQR